MFRAIGLLIVLWGLSHFFSQTFQAVDDAGKATFQVIKTSSEVFEAQIQKSK